jgi:hypothetical protein
MNVLPKEKLKSVFIVNISLAKSFWIGINPRVGFFSSSVARIGSLFLRKSLVTKNGEKC